MLIHFVILIVLLRKIRPKRCYVDGTPLFRSAGCGMWAAQYMQPQYLPRLPGRIFARTFRQDGANEFASWMIEVERFRCSIDADAAVLRRSKKDGVKYSKNSC